MTAVEDQKLTKLCSLTEQQALAKINVLKHQKFCCSDNKGSHHVSCAQMEKTMKILIKDLKNIEKV